MIIHTLRDVTHNPLHPSMLPSSLSTSFRGVLETNLCISPIDAVSHILLRCVGIYVYTAQK
jgi:hypothetical protein